MCLLSVIYYLVDTDFYFIDGSTDTSVPVTIPMGVTTHDVSFTVRSDTIIEIDETFGLEIDVTAESSSLGVLLSGSNAAIVTLQDDNNFGKFVRCSLILTYHLRTPYNYTCIFLLIFVSNSQAIHASFCFICKCMSAADIRNCSQTCLQVNIFLLR